jgi:hypothetical protein
MKGHRGCSCRGGVLASRISGIEPTGRSTGLLYSQVDGADDMPKFRTHSTTGPPTPIVEFDLCTRCAEDGDIVRTVVSGKLGIPLEEGNAPPAERIPHRSYDFQPRPTPCISCARILSSEDD